MTRGSREPSSPRLQALGGIAAISFSAIFVRASGVSPGTSAFYRAAYAVPVLLLLAHLARRRIASGNAGLPAGRSGRLRLLAAAGGVFLAIDLNLWHRSIEYVGAGLATVVANLQVLFVAALAWILHGERPTRAAFLAIPLALVGVLLTTGLGRADAYGSAPALGAVLGVLTALAYSGYLLFFRAGTRGAVSPAGPLLDATLGTAAAGLLLGVVFDAGFDLRPVWPAHGWLLALALGAHTLGWLAIARALPALPALETSVLLLLQPCLTMVWGLLLFREVPSLVQAAGVLLVLVGVGLVSVLGAAEKADARAPAGLTPSDTSP